MDQEDVITLNSLRNQIEDERAKTREAQMHLASTMFSSDANENLVKWQLDIKEELERIERLLKKQIPRRDAKGNEYFENPLPEAQLFNEYGVQEILNLLAWYLNKNIILSDFDEYEINLRVLQFGQYLNDFMFLNYEKFGLTDPDKIKHFPLVHMNIVNTVEAAYHRALGGKERDSLRTARTVTQTEPLGTAPLPFMQQKKFSLIKPTTWFKG